MDPMIASATSDLAQSQRDELRGYIKDHPEVRSMLQDFIVSVIASKPDDVHAFAREYFGSFRKQGNP